MRKRILLLALIMGLGVFSAGCEKNTETLESTQNASSAETEIPTSETQSGTEESTTEESQAEIKENPVAPLNEYDAAVWTQKELTQENAEAIIWEILDRLAKGDVEGLKERAPKGLSEFAMSDYESYKENADYDIQLVKIYNLKVAVMDDPEELKSIYKDPAIMMEAYMDEQNYNDVSAIAVVELELESTLDGETNYESTFGYPIFTLMHQNNQWTCYMGEGLPVDLYQYHINYTFDDTWAKTYKATSCMKIVNGEVQEIPFSEFASEKGMEEEMSLEVTGEWDQESDIYTVTTNYSTKSGEMSIISYQYIGFNYYDYDNRYELDHQLFGTEGYLQLNPKESATEHIFDGFAFFGEYLRIEDKTVMVELMDTKDSDYVQYYIVFSAQ